MEHIDRWWNDVFPAYSVRRLAFGLAVTPVIGFAVGGLRAAAFDGAFSWSTYFMTILGVQFVLAVGWFLARSRQDVLTPERAPVRPWRPVARIHPVRDFLLTTGISFVGITITTLLIGYDLFSGGQLLTNVAAAIAAALVIHFRYSPLPLVLVAVAVGFPVAFFFELFTMFLSDDDLFVETWVMTSLVALIGMIPGWLQLRAAKARLESLRIPSYVIALVGNVLMVIAIAFASIGGDPVAAERGSPAGDTRTDEVVTPPAPSFGVPSPATAGNTMLTAWTFNDVERARTVASSEAVTALFVSRPPVIARFAGCTATPPIVCTIETSEETIDMHVQPLGDGLVYISHIERRPSSDEG